MEVAGAQGLYDFKYDVTYSYIPTELDGGDDADTFHIDASEGSDGKLTV